MSNLFQVTQNSDSNEPSGSQLTDQHANSTQILQSNPLSTSQPTNKKRSNVQATTTRKKQMSIENKQEKLVDTAQKLLTSSDDWQIIGQSIGLQLKDLNKHQLIFVQKIISDAIYYGKLNKLTEQSSIHLANLPAQFRTTYNESPLPNNVYQFSSDSSSVTPIHTPSPQLQVQSPMPSPQAQSFTTLQSPQYAAQSSMPFPQPQSSVSPQTPRYHTQSHIPSSQYQAQSSISFQSTQHTIQASESLCRDNSNNNSEMTEFLLFNKDQT